MLDSTDIIRGTVLAFLLASQSIAQVVLPATVKTSWPPGEEAVYAGHTYREPATDHVLRIAYSTPNTPDTLQGSQTYKLWYQVSNDGGDTFTALQQLIQQGEQFDSDHPVRGVNLRKIGFVTSRQPPLRASNGKIMVAIELWRLDENGEAYNPAHPYTYCDSAVLIGQWKDNYADVAWDMSDRVQLDLDQSTAGAYEPGLIELSEPGHFAISLRGSNIGQPAMPSYKWIAISRDFCRTWTKPRPLTYTTGKRFFSPSACSEFLRHSNGKIYWIGNIISENANGNNPRDPLIIAEFDEKLGAIRKHTVHDLFTRNLKRDSPKVEFSNFVASEHPTSGNIIIKAPLFDVGNIPEGYEGNVNSAPFPWAETIYEVK